MLWIGLGIGFVLGFAVAVAVGYALSYGRPERTQILNEMRTARPMEQEGRP